MIIFLTHRVWKIACSFILKKVGERVVFIYIKNLFKNYFKILKHKRYVRFGRIKIINSNLFVNSQKKLNKSNFENDTNFLKSCINYLFGFLFLPLNLWFFLGEKKFHSDIIYFTTNNNIKFFDFDKESVISLINNENKYKKLKYVNKTNLKILNYITPQKIISLDDDKNLIKEKIIDGINVNNLDFIEKEKALNFFYKKYYRFLNNTFNNEYITINSLLNKLTERKGFEKILKLSKNKLNSETKIPIIKTHGDICFKNILKKDDSNKYYFIDWEHFGKRAMFYDLINILFVEAMDNQNYYFLLNFIEKKYNNTFKEFLYINNENLLLIYIIERILNNDIEKTIKEREYKQDQYLKILRNVILKY